ncbi:hypothetical protein ATO8_12986 [Roseivivax marinus]|uniref:Uncharacterized protein n=1 Tax=Roseivivax marinus TaxID=1379903 RepID=W4HJ86_9RHOB|nr:hypothetical protein [Roseivivax marinus]ETW12468.1 hypothetical protein ATO8_12986 [Roseivivax marinus]SEK27327.1 hypothetical protein SAMN05444413_101225 [Roseivivax marinus]
MYDDLETRMRQLISDAEADIGFERDGDAAPRRFTGTHAMRDAMEFWTAPAISMMRAMWFPFSRR